jgi:hypothetical protein
MGAGRGREDLTPPCMHGARTHSLLACMHMHLVHAMHLHTSKQGGRGHASSHLRTKLKSINLYLFVADIDGPLLERVEVLDAEAL